MCVPDRSQRWQRSSDGFLRRLPTLRSAHVAMQARSRLDDGADDNDFFQRVAGDEAFGLSHDDLEALADATFRKEEAGG